MNRRNFLAKTSVVTAATVLSSAFAVESQRKIKTGFLGITHSHAAEKIKQVRESSDFELIGFNEESAVARDALVKSGVPHLASEDLLSKCELVIVESAVRDHARHAKLALQAGCHIHVEKPPTNKLADFQTLQKLARDKQRLMQTGYMWRNNPGINAALEAARQGWLGEIYLVRGMLNTQIPAERRPEMVEFKGGILFELGCHLIDPAVRLLGRPDKVTSHLKKHGNFADDMIDNAMAVLEYPKAMVMISSSSLQPAAGLHRSFEILGSQGTIRVNPIEPPELQVNLTKAVGPYKKGMQTVTLPEYKRYVAEFAELANAIREKKPLSTTPEEERLVHETLLRACDMI